LHDARSRGLVMVLFLIVVVVSITLLGLAGFVASERL
jgi:Tfp pilus assembly protein PilX